jgi:hypothetical protein
MASGRGRGKHGMTSGYGYTRKAWQEARQLALARAHYRSAGVARARIWSSTTRTARGPINGSNAQADLLVLCRGVTASTTRSATLDPVEALGLRTATDFDSIDSTRSTPEGDQVRRDPNFS